MQIQRYGLRVVGQHDQADWQPRLTEQIATAQVLCRAEVVTLETIELDLECTRVDLEAIGYEILQGALGFTPRYVIVQNPDHQTYFLRKTVE
ncbi:hypothetical protein [Chitiniphilus eburneus]|uniref:Uncharacterized protein n=1 Tax=Chitiniphilus eburneus TaxID=2571148 RepID=A0A4U0Q6B2_9NEIS|nr:hypothetical protein [Chitiniphilus eburneus]TJZ76320.1 hypothetical protein FAZ21_05980 [Chitiniphilus eburneus]